MAITMKDIAKELGLSVVTISKVLRNHPDISDETRERVLRHVRDLDYQPNVLARSLVTGRSFLIGLIVPDLIHPFFAEVAKALSLAIRESGYSLIISSAEEDPELEWQELRQLLARRLDAIAIASTATSPKYIERLQQDKQPYVLIDRNVGEGSNFVGIDDRAAGRIATQHLINVGCRKIAHIRGRENSTGVNRYQGYCDALLSNGLPVVPEYVISRTKVDTQSILQGAEAARALIELQNRPDGIFCYNDPLAIGAMHAIFNAGLRIPEDIALIGCGNLHYDMSLRVGLSSIDQQSQQIGEEAGKILLSIIEAKTAPPPRSVIIAPSLVVRESTQR